MNQRIKSRCHCSILMLVLTCLGLSLAQTVTNETLTQLAKSQLPIGDDQLPQSTSIPCGANCNCCPKPRDCMDIQALTSVSGIYTIYVGHMQRPVQVYCDMTTDGGGWTVFQRRKDGSTNFYRSWNWYTLGFGDPANEFWLGLRNIYDILSNGHQYALRIDLGDFSGNTRYAFYDNFKIGPASSLYALTSLGAFSGNAGDSLTPHIGYAFTTYDQDHDSYSGNCAVAFHGAWWYIQCHASNLNGYYYPNALSAYGYGVIWYSWTGIYTSLKSTEMKIR